MLEFYGKLTIKGRNKSKPKVPGTWLSNPKTIVRRQLNDLYFRGDVEIKLVKDLSQEERQIAHDDDLPSLEEILRIKEEQRYGHREGVVY